MEALSRLVARPRQYGRMLGFVSTLSLSAATFGLIIELGGGLAWRANPFPNASRVVLVRVEASADAEAAPLAAPLRRALREEPAPFIATAAFSPAGKLHPHDDPSRELSAAWVDASLFTVLGVAPVVGRTFTLDDQSSGADVAVISYDLWRTKYGKSSTVLGQSLETGTRVYVVVGVLPKEVVFPDRETQVWLPRPLALSDAVYTNVVGLLPNAAATVDASQRLQREAVAHGEKLLSFRFVNLRDFATGRFRAPIAVMVGAAAILLALTLLNLVGLQLASVLSRADEIIVRAALGATTSTICRTLLIDALLLGAASGLIALLLIAMGAPLFEELVRRTMVDVPVLDQLGRPYAVGAASALGVAAMSTLPSMFVAARISLNPTLIREPGGPSSAGRTVVTIGQIALATMLCAAALGFSVSLIKLTRVEVGFQPRDIWIAALTSFDRPTVDPLAARSHANSIQFLIDRGEAGLGPAAIASGIPFLRYDTRLSIAAPLGREPNVAYPVDTAAITSDHFRVLGIRLLGGRAFIRRESPTNVAILDRLLAEQLFGSSDAALQQVVTFLGRALTVVGVVDPVRRFGLVTPPAPVLYVPFEQWPVPLVIAVAPLHDTNSVAALRVAITRADRDWRVQRILPLEPMIARELIVPKATAAASAAMGGIGLSIALLGIATNAVLSSLHRRREYGIRLAMGATRWRVLRLAMRRGVGVAVTGALLGVLLWRWASAAAGVVLFELQPSHIGLVATAGSMCALVAITGWYLAVRRLCDVDPIEVMRTE
jgi:putative ABC transport system permease protein